MLKVKDEFIISKLKYWGFVKNGNKWIKKLDEPYYIMINEKREVYINCEEMCKRTTLEFNRELYDLIKGGVLVWK